MDRVILDEALKAKLNGLDKQLELCDADGKALGQFVPQDWYRELFLAWSKAWISDEEMERLCQQTGGRPLAEIWKDLGRQ